MGPNERIEFRDSDPVREYSPDEEAHLTRNLHALTVAVHSGAFSHLAVDSRLLTALHRNIFHAVRSHAGRCRSYDFGSEHVVFGPHRSVHRSRVNEALDEAFAQFNQLLRYLEENPEVSDFEQLALRAAVLLHADIIRIHPFEDGNGRTCRSLMNVVLVRLGLLPVAIEVPKQEYIAALNHLFNTSSATELLHLILHLYLAPRPAEPSLTDHPA